MKFGAIFLSAPAVLAVDWASQTVSSLRALAPGDFAACTPAEWSTVPAAALAGLAAAQLAALPPATFAATADDQLAFVGVGTYDEAFVIFCFHTHTHTFTLAEF
jgi:hypothetical protein